jgi:hypothetical protein
MMKAQAAKKQLSMSLPAQAMRAQNAFFKALCDPSVPPAKLERMYVALQKLRRVRDQARRAASK